MFKITAGRAEDEDVNLPAKFSRLVNGGIEIIQGMKVGRTEP